MSNHCPFPDLMKYVDPDTDSLAVPFVAGDFAVATNSRILACRPSAGWDGPMASPSVFHSSVRIASAVWSLPAAAFRPMPTSADHIETRRCDTCGGGTHQPRSVCDVCNGSGACPCCDRDCMACGGSGRDGDVETFGGICGYCGGPGVIATGAYVVVLGATVDWKYAGLLMTLGARVAVWDLDVHGHRPLCFAVGDLRGIVMPVRLNTDTREHLPVLMEAEARP